MGWFICFILDDAFLPCALCHVPTLCTLSFPYSYSSTTHTFVLLCNPLFHWYFLVFPQCKRCLPPGNNFTNFSASLPPPPSWKPFEDLPSHLMICHVRSYLAFVFFFRAWLNFVGLSVLFSFLSTSLPPSH